MALRLFFIAVISYFSSSYANLTHLSEVPCPSSIMTIEEATLSDTLTIYLNNQTAWTCAYTDLFAGLNGWRCGDRVHLVYVYSEGYYLQNASSQGCVPVTLQKKNRDDWQVNRIQEISSGTKKASHTILLDNGTRWYVGGWSSSWMSSWKAGDRVIATTQEFLFGSADHLLINLDQERDDLPENVRAQLLYSPQAITYEDFNKREIYNWETTITNSWQDDSSFMVVLNNRTVWRCPQPRHNWRTGDSLKFEAHDSKYSLVNLRHSETIEGTLMNGYAEEIWTPFIQKITENGDKILLSDGSVWFSANNAFESWEPGCRIIVSPLGHVSTNTSTHCLVNLDKLANGKKCPNAISATLIK